MEPMPSERAEANGTPALWRAGLALVAVHVVVAAWAWGRALRHGAGQADVVSAAYALLLTAIAASLVTTGPVVARRGRRAVTVWLAAAALTLPVDVWLARRSAEPRFRYEVALSSGLYEAPGHAFRWSVTLAEPFTEGQHALFQLERRGRSWTLPLALRRSPRDNVAAGAWGLGLRELGAQRWWLVVGTGWTRRGPQFFLLDWSADAPRLEEVKRGLTVEDGRARWACDAWGAPTPDVVRAESLCPLDGTLPPVRACQLETLAAACGPALPQAAGCQPDLAGESPKVLECLERRAADGDPLAWDALVLTTAVARDGPALYQLLIRSRAAEEVHDPICAALRHGARQLAAGRQLGRWWEWVRVDGATTLLAARRLPEAAGRDCPALPPVAAALALDDPALGWEATRSAREAGRADDACARVLAMAERGELARLAPADRGPAREWHAACVARQPPPATTPSTWKRAPRAASRSRPRRGSRRPGAC